MWNATNHPHRPRFWLTLAYHSRFAGVFLSRKGHATGIESYGIIHVSMLYL